VIGVPDPRCIFLKELDGRSTGAAFELWTKIGRSSRFEMKFLRAIRPTVVVLALPAVLACASAPKHQPVASMSSEDARRFIYRVLEEQPPGFGVSDLEITNDKLAFARGQSRYFGPVPTSSYVEKTTFYFDGFGSAKISDRKRKGHVVWIYDKARTARFRVVVPTEADAKRFVDAIYVLSLSTATERAN
jgi:hypothetical protein